MFGNQVTGSPYTTGAPMNAGSGTPCDYPISGGTGTCGSSTNQLGRIDIAVAPSNPNYIYAQAQSIVSNNNGGCGNTNGCQLGAWASTDGGASWSFYGGLAGGSLRDCSSGQGDYPQNWYDQGIAVDPNNPDRVFFDTFDVWFATRTGTSGMIPLAVILTAAAQVLCTWTSTLSPSCPARRASWQLGTMAASTEPRTRTSYTKQRRSDLV